MVAPAGWVVKMAKIKVVRSSEMFDRKNKRLCMSPLRALGECYRCKRYDYCESKIKTDIKKYWKKVEHPDCKYMWINTASKSSVYVQKVPAGGWVVTAVFGNITGKSWYFKKLKEALSKAKEIMEKHPTGKIIRKNI